MEKAVEIKRRAQRCVQNGDLDGALKEYEKLVAVDNPDPYNHVLIADILFKKGDQQGSASRYLQAAESYEIAGLFKNGIAVCKKMMRLSLASGAVLRRLATLHAHAGLGTESALYYMQYAEQKVRAGDYKEATQSFRSAAEASPDNARALERLAEVMLLQEDKSSAASALLGAAEAYTRNGQLEAARQCRTRANQLDPNAKSTPMEGPPGSSLRSGTADPLGRGSGGNAGPPSAKTPANGKGGRGAVPERQMFGEGPFDGPGEASGNGSEDLQIEPGLDPSGLETTESSWRDAVTGAGPPGLNFEAPTAHLGPGPSSDGLEQVEQILAEAQEHFRNNDRAAASKVLARAAEAYEKLGKHDSAASIYRSLAKSAQVTVEILNRWLVNCETREDWDEAARVACELGDRALADDDRAKAREWFESAVQFDAGNEHALRRLERLAGRTAAAEVQPAAEPEDEGADAVEVADERGADRVELSVGRGEAVTFDLGSVISEFQRGVEAQLSGDAQSHYDLAMAYREMGLLEQAVEAFRVAGGDSAYANRCAEMIGRCLLDQGRFDEAVDEFRAALAVPEIDSDTEASLRYQLGLAHEAAGRTDEALAEFEGVYAAQPNYPDVALKIRVLRKSMESL